MASEPQASPEQKPPDAPPAPAPSEAAPSVPIATTAEAKPKLKIKPPPKKKWTPPAPPSGLNKLAWRLVIGATVLATLLLGAIIVLMVESSTPPANTAPQLAEDFRDPVNNWSICPPVNWDLQDPHDGNNFFIKGPKERGYIPLITVCVDVAAGHLESYLKEYKDRLQVQDSSVKFVAETPVKVDNYDSVRLVYTWTMDNADKSVTHVKTVQYIVADPPRFYRISGSVREDAFDKYLPRFDASAKSFKILPLNAPVFKTLPPQ